MTRNFQIQVVVCIQSLLGDHAIKILGFADFVLTGSLSLFLVAKEKMNFYFSVRV